MRIVCLHGLGGTGATVGPLADSLRAAGHDVVAPTLAGHGGHAEDLLGVGWSDWLRAIPADAEVVVGQSMGASLALAVAATRTSVQAVVAINPLAPDPDAVDGLEWRRDRGHDWVDAPSAMPGEVAAERIPISSLLEMTSGVLATDLAAVTCPVLVVTSALDDVVDPASSDVVVAALGGPVERLVLPRSGHVATLDVEAPLLGATVLGFVDRLR